MTSQLKTASQLDLSAPVIVTGLGGSGTRLVATLLEHLGIYMGHYRSPEMDSGFFGKLISRYPELWVRQDPAFYGRLGLFAKLHLGKLLSPRELFALYQSVTTPRGEEFRLVLKRAYLPIKKTSGPYVAWGFKYPAALYFMHQLSKHFPQAKYIHVIRHGLDMVYSQNTTQIKNWGHAFGIDTSGDEITASARLDFWIRVNQWVVEKGPLLFPERFYILSFDQLCSDKEASLKRLSEFLELPQMKNIPLLLDLIRTPESIGRYKEHPIAFRADQIQAVRKFGFEVDDVNSESS